MEINGTRVYAEQNGPVIDLIVREDLAGSWVDAASSAELIAGVDEETGLPIYSEGVSVSKAPTIIITPAVLDDEEEVITPAVTDDRLHLNIRIGGKALEADHAHLPMKKRQVTCLSWMQQGQDAAPNNHEAGKTLLGITLIDPETVHSPALVWA